MIKVSMPYTGVVHFTTCALGKNPPGNTMERGVAASEPMGLVLNCSGLLAQSLDQHPCLNSSDVRHKPLSKVAMESPLLLNKINLLLNKNDRR